MGVVDTFYQYCQHKETANKREGSIELKDWLAAHTFGKLL